MTYVAFKNRTPEEQAALMANVTPTEYKPLVKWQDLPEEEKNRLLKRSAKRKENSWNVLSETGKQEIEKLRNAPFKIWTAGRMLCYICNEECQNVSCRYTRMPYIAHPECVDEAPIYRTPVKFSTQGEIKPKRAQDVEGWVRNFHDQLTATSCTVHDVRNWIKSQGGPEFSYAGTRRMCKLLFEESGRGMFNVPKVLVDTVSKRSQKGNKKASKKNVSLKQYTKTGRRKHGVKKGKK